MFNIFVAYRVYSLHAFHTALLYNIHKYKRNIYFLNESLLYCFCGIGCDFTLYL